MALKSQNLKSARIDGFMWNIYVFECLIFFAFENLINKVDIDFFKVNRCLRV